jgi:hypothetical protein
MSLAHLFEGRISKQISECGMSIKHKASFPEAAFIK